MRTKFNPWESISGAVSLNVFTSLVNDKPKKIEELVLPVCCGFYISAHWNNLNFSKSDKLSELRNHISPEVVKMKEILLENPDKVLGQINGYLDHLNGSLAFSVVVIQALYNGNQDIYKNDFGLLFQESWEVIFWYLQDLKDEPTRKIIFDFADHHVSTFNSVIENINTMNPL